MSDVNLRLQGLVQRLQQQQLQDDERDRLLDELTEQIRQSGQLAYPPRGTLASSLYQDFCQQALQATLTEIRQKIESYHANNSIIEWVNKILERKFNEIVSAHQIERQLQQLAERAQQHPPKTIERQRALNELVNGIRQSKRIGHPQRSLWKPGLYQDLHSEAFQETLIVVCQKIDTYNADYPVMAWVNIILERRFSDVVEKYRRMGMTNLPKLSKGEDISKLSQEKIFQEEKRISLLSLDDLETMPLSNPEVKDPINEACSDEQLVRDFLRTDPEKLLRSSHIKARPDLTFQKLIWAKFVDDRRWEDLAREWEVPLPTISSFYQRNLHKLKPYFQKYLRN